MSRELLAPSIKGELLALYRENCRLCLAVSLALSEIYKLQLFFTCIGARSRSNNLDPSLEGSD